MEYAKWSAKAIWGLVAPILIVFINDNTELVQEWVAGIVAGVITGILVWIQKNAPKPT